MRWLPHAIALALTLPFVVWVATSDIRGVLHPAMWALPLVAAYYLGLRIGREVRRGIVRSRGGPEAEPDAEPEAEPDADEAGEADER